MCSQCADLDTTVPTGCPSSLTQVLKVIRDDLADATIAESAYWPPGQVAIDRPAFGSLPLEGPWPDYLEYYFTCLACDRRFRLAADIYHGRVGELVAAASLTRFGPQNSRRGTRKRMH